MSKLISVLGLMALASLNSFSPVHAFDGTQPIPGQILCDQDPAAVAAGQCPSRMPVRIQSSDPNKFLQRQSGVDSWEKCPAGNFQDSTCVVTYKYSAPAAAATITAGFTKANPFIGGAGTSPYWTTVNAVRVAVVCSGLGVYNNSNAPTQGSPSGVTFTSPTAGPVTCNFTAWNSDNRSVTVTSTANFVAPIPPTIQAGFVRPNFNAGTGGSEIQWATQNAKSVYVACSGFNWGPGFVGLQGNPSGVRMDRDTTGSISCTFTATNEVGQTATATASANVTRPPPPQVNAAYQPANINVGQTSQLVYTSANATVLGIVCNGLWGAAVSSPESLYLNQGWYFTPQTWPDAGSQQCSINAFNSMGEVAIVYFSLDVAPAGIAPSGGGSTDGGTYPPGTPGAPTPTGSGASHGTPPGYYNPATGLYSSDPAGLHICTCGNPESPTVNVTPTPTGTDNASSGTDTGGGTTTTASTP